jgi:hypothetical protein
LLMFSMDGPFREWISRRLFLTSSTGNVLCLIKVMCISLIRLYQKT